MDKSYVFFFSLLSSFFFIYSISFRFIWLETSNFSFQVLFFLYFSYSSSSKFFFSSFSRNAVNNSALHVYLLNTHERNASITLSFAHSSMPYHSTHIPTVCEYISLTMDSVYYSPFLFRCLPSSSPSSSSSFFVKMTRTKYFSSSEQENEANDVKIRENDEEEEVKKEYHSLSHVA